MQLSAPARISDLSVRSPSSNFSAPMMIDFPDPVSPVTDDEPADNTPVEIFGIKGARFWMRSEESMAGNGDYAQRKRNLEIRKSGI